MPPQNSAAEIQHIKNCQKRLDYELRSNERFGENCMITQNMIESDKTMRSDGADVASFNDNLSMEVLIIIVSIVAVLILILFVIKHFLGHKRGDIEADMSQSQGMENEELKN